MCGIAGLWCKQGWSEREFQEKLEAMLQPIAPRGPDGHGTWIDLHRQIGLGHRRLSILDLSNAGSQPMVEENPAQCAAISYNGEIYNFKELRGELAKLGICFRSHSDTEVILKSYLAWGEAAFKELSGIFAFGLADLVKGKLFLVRDPVGVKPLYVCQGSFGLAFGSIPSQFVAAGLAHDLDPEVLAVYLRGGYVPMPASIYAGVEQVPPGEYWQFNINGASCCKHIVKYFDVICQDLSAHKKAVNEGTDFGSLLEMVVEKQLVSDVPIGCFLSGGVDSTSVALAMTRVSPERVKTFTVGFPGWAENEAAVARRTSQILDTQHFELEVTGEEALNVLPTVFAIFDEPFADPSAIPTYLISRFAREHVTVTLSGDGGDELFAGYRRYGFIWGKRPWIYSLSPALRTWLQYFCTSLRRKDLLCIRTLDEFYCYQLIQFSPRELSALWPGVTQKPLSFGEMNGKGLTPLRRAMTQDFLTYLPGDILVKLDRCTMAVGLEGRVPLLDTRIAAYSADLSDIDLIRSRQTKWPLRDYIRSRMPTEHLNQPKRGFGIPMGAWLRAELRERLEDLLHSDLCDPLGVFSRSFIQQLVRNHISGKADHAYQLWTLLALAEWNMRRLGRS